MLTRDKTTVLPLEGFSVGVSPTAGLAVRTCAQHLALLGASVEHTGMGKEDVVVLRSNSSGVEITCRIPWLPSGWGEAANASASELLVQSISGLMALNGKDLGVPRRLGLDVASVVAGIAAAQGVLATLIANSHEQRITTIETSVLQAGMTFLYHHLALATCEDKFTFAEPAPAPGPPFKTADGYWIELEVLTFDGWIGFWRQLGVERAGLERAWGNFVYRYLAASCTLPVTLHEATAQKTLDELRRIAEPLGIAILVVRGYSDLLDEMGLTRGGGLERQGARSSLHPETPWTILPQIEHHAAPVVQNSLNAAQGPLAGMRVVEVSSRLQGPLAGLLLQMLGAEVTKVEPIGGDFGRYAPPKAGSQGAAYMAYNRDKTVVEIDYKSEEGRAQMLDLIANADVFLHNWRSGRAEKTGFDFESFARINPRLVYAHASGWGRIDDEPSPIAGDFLVQAQAATGEGLNPIDEPPFPSRVTLVDVTGGLLACEGILAGLYLREQTGQGCRVDTSLFSAAMELQAEVLKAIALGQEQGREWGRPIWGTLDRPIETADGFVMLSAEDEPTREKLRIVCKVSTSDDEEAVDERIAAKLHSRPTAEWVEILGEARIVATPVCTDVADLPNDPRIVELLERVEDACWVPSAPWRFRTN